MKKLSFLLCIVASLSLQISNTIFKKLDNVGPYTIAAGRFLVMLMVVLPMAAFSTGDVFPKGSRFLLVTRSLFAALHNIISYYAMKHLPLPDVTIINATGAVFACVPARMFLKERITFSHVINIIANIIGMVLVIKPPFLFSNETNASGGWMSDEMQSTALGYITFSSLFFLSNTYVVDRSLKNLHATTSLACVGIGGFVTSIVMAIWNDGTVLPKSSSDIPIIFLGAIFSLLTNFCVTMATKMEMAGKVALTAKSTQILFSFVFQILFFNKQPSINSIGGAAIILIALLYSGMSNLIKVKSGSDKKEGGKDVIKKSL